MKLKVSAVYENGVLMLDETPFVTDIELVKGKSNSNVSVVVLRIASTTQGAEQLYSALTSGTPEINIEGVPL